jgi:hypothetical protein
MDQRSYLGDEVIPAAPMVYNQTRVVKARANDIFPWVIQLGKGRGGWYLSKRWERWLPQSWRASSRIDSSFQDLAVGDHVPDYGGKDDYFDVVLIDRPHSLVYESVRYGTKFTWAILLHEKSSESESELVETVVHLRFRGGIAATGLKRKLILWGGGILDHITTAPMLAGLAERVEGSHLK